MPHAVLSVKIKCLPGKRDEVKTLWERMTKQHAAESGNVQSGCYAGVCTFRLQQRWNALFTHTAAPGD